MRMIVLLSGCFWVALAGVAGEPIKEPSTGVVFADSLNLSLGRVECTGADVRVKFFMNIYAIAHYGTRDAWPQSGTAEAKLTHWAKTDTLKAVVLKFTYNVSKEKIRNAWDEGLKDTYHNDKTKNELLAAFKEDLKKGDELRFVAGAEGTFSAELNGKSLGVWKDTELIRAMWQIWLGNNSVLSDRKNLVKQP